MVGKYHHIVLQNMYLIGVENTMNISHLSDLKPLLLSESAIEMQEACNQIEQYCRNETLFRDYIEQITQESFPEKIDYSSVGELFGESIFCDYLTIWTLGVLAQWNKTLVDSKLDLREVIEFEPASLPNSIQNLSITDLTITHSVWMQLKEQITTLLKLESLAIYGDSDSFLLFEAILLYVQLGLFFFLNFLVEKKEI